MSKDKFMNPDYKPDKNTCQEIEKLHDEGVSLSGIYLKDIMKYIMKESGNYKQKRIC